MKFLCTLVFSLAIIFNGFSQGKIDGFYKGKNNGTIVLGLGFEDPKNYFAGYEKLDLGRSLYYVAIFSAYGITDNLDVNVSLPYLSSNKQSGFQDISIFFKHRFFQSVSEKGDLDFSFGVGLSTPISNYNIGGLNDLGQQATILEARVMAHYKWKIGWFVTLQSGFSFKFKETPNSIPLTFKAGKAAGNWYYDVFYDYQHSLGGIDYRGTPSPQNFKELGVTYQKVGGTLYKSFTENFGTAINLSYSLQGRNSFQGPSYGLSIVYNL
ncbi:transporter [Aequorivita sp. Q41]|uniref:transporter n=1 Tax=Aequorivita sp. Q41 TaxID=3153300 RepID=UPI003241CE96